MASSTHEFKVEMTCDGCANAVKRVLGKQGSDVQDVQVDVAARSVIVTSTLPHDKLQQIIAKTGKETTYIGAK